MFVVVYHYQIPMEKTIDYIKLEQQAIKVYLEKGCLGVEIYRDAKDPRRWMEINRFEDMEHYNKVIGTVNEDERIERLFEEFQELMGEREEQPEKDLYYRMI